MSDKPPLATVARKDMETEPLTAAPVQYGVLGALANRTDQNGLLKVEPCCRIKEGCHHVVWSVGSHIIHARPSSTKNIESLERDRATTMLLKNVSTAPHTISVPSEVFRIGGWICTVQEKLPGRSLQACPGARSSSNTRDGVVELLGTLRSVPREQAMKAVHYEHERPNLRKRVAKALRHWKELQDIGYTSIELQRVRQTLSLNPLQHFEQPVYEAVMLHGDLSMQHILVDESDGTITGVIDWSDAMLGDPCEDIAGVALSLGVDAARRVATKAGYDEHTVARGLLFAKCLAIEDLRELKCGSDEQPPEELLRAQFNMAFEDTDFVI